MSTTVDLTVTIRRDCLALDPSDGTAGPLLAGQRVEYVGVRPDGTCAVPIGVLERVVAAMAKGE